MKKLFLILILMFSFSASAEMYPDSESTKEFLNKSITTCMQEQGKSKAHCECVYKNSLIEAEFDFVEWYEYKDASWDNHMNYLFDKWGEWCTEERSNAFKNLPQKFTKECMKVTSDIPKYLVNSYHKQKKHYCNCAVKNVFSRVPANELLQYSDFYTMMKEAIRYNEDRDFAYRDTENEYKGIIYSVREQCDRYNDKGWFKDGETKYDITR